MRKGFTLIELAIVLVIIGMILSVTMKGKQLVKIAKLKNDVYKFVKIETAVKTHIAAGKSIKVYDSIYGGITIDPFSSNSKKISMIKKPSISPFAMHTNYSYVDMDPLYDQGVFTRADLYMKYYQFNIPFGSQEMPYLGIIFCHPTLFYNMNHGSTNLRLNNLCITSVQPTNGKIGGIITDIPAPINCGVEVMLDDMNVNTGRYGKDSANPSDPFPNFTQEDFDNCENLPAKYSSNPANGGHMGIGMFYYRIFAR